MMLKRTDAIALIRARRVALLTTIPLAVVALSGCSTGVEETAINHSEAAAELNTLLEIAQSEVGGDWTSFDSGAEDCALPGEGTGVRYTYNRNGAGVPEEQQQAVIDTVVAGWAETGIEATVSPMSAAEGPAGATQIVFPATGEDDAGLWVSIRIAPTVTSVMGTTRCVPGDSYEINKERIGKE